MDVVEITVTPASPATDPSAVPPWQALPRPRRPGQQYWPMVFAAAGLAADPWEPATLLDGDKKFCGRLPIPDAAALVEGIWDSLHHAEQDLADEGQPGFLARTVTARALVIRAGKDVLSIDHDDRSTIPALLTLYRALRAAGCPTIMLTSGRVPDIPNPTSGGSNPFGVHLWAWGLTPDQVEHFKGLARNLGLRCSPLLRPPLSPHPSNPIGSPVGVYFTDPENTLDIMHQCAAGEIEARGRHRLYAPATVSSKSRSLSAQLDRLLRAEVPDGKRHPAIQAVALGAVNVRLTQDDYVKLILHSKALGDKVREQGGDRAQLTYLERQWERAVTYAQSRPPVAGGPTVQAAVAKWREEVEHTAWPGVAGTTDRRIMFDHLATIQRTGSLRHRDSVREIAERVCVNCQTVSRSHARLLKRSGLGLRVAGDQQLSGHGPSRAILWEIRETSCRMNGPFVCEAFQHEANGPLLRQPLSHDVWRHRALGLAGAAVWHRLDPLQPVTVAVLVLALGRHRSAVYRQLARLEQHGLAVKTPLGWLRGPADLDQVAKDLEVDGVGARQQARHQYERAEFVRKLQEQREQTPQTRQAARARKAAREVAMVKKSKEGVQVSAEKSRKSAGART